MSRKLKYPIRVKIIAVIAAVVLGAMAVYGFVAIKLFNDDKTAYIFESSKNNAENAATQVNTFLSRIVRTSLVIYNMLSENEFRVIDVPYPVSFDEVVQPDALFPAQAQTVLEQAKAAARSASSDAERLALGTDVAKARLVLADALSARDLQKNRAEIQDLLATAESELRPFLIAEGTRDQYLNNDSRGYTAYIYAEIARQLGRYHDAETWYRQVVDEYGDMPYAEGARLQLAESYYRRREFGEAEAAYKKAMQAKDPAIASYAHYKAAWIKFQMGHHGQSLAAFQQVLKFGTAGAGETLYEAALENATWVFAESTFKPAAFYRKVANGRSYLAKIRARKQDLKARSRSGTSTLGGHRLLKQLFYGDPDFVEFSVFEQKNDKVERIFRLVNNEHLTDAGFDVAYLDHVDSQKPIPFANVQPAVPLLMNSTLPGGMGILSLVRQDPNTKRYLVTRIRLDQFLDPFVRNRVYSTFLIDANGDLFAHQDAQKMADATNMLSEPFVVEVVQSKSTSGVLDYTTREGAPMLLAYSQVGLFNLFTMAEISKEKAFLAARQLMEQSIWFGLTLIFIAILIGVIFAKTLTQPVSRLFAGTQIIAQGDFKTRVDIKSNDEIGILSDSFNYMAGRIVSLLEQEKDKVRMEEELKVAKLVQDSFFPAEYIDTGDLEISAFYTPSSECGGDWWGCLRFGDKTIILIGDATGHGVPAALVTATAASCTNTLREIARVNPAVLDSPAEILRILNRAVFACAQGKILMTFFAAMIDSAAGKITYSNASHNPPFVYRHKDSEPSKRDLKPLMEANGLRLGHKEDAEYTVEETDIGPNDSIVFFTDGFIECTNPQNEEYGNRKFIKSILSHIKTDVKSIRDGIVGDARKFYDGHPLNDDLTMVIAKVKADAKERHQAA